MLDGFHSVRRLVGALTLVGAMLAGGTGYAGAASRQGVTHHATNSGTRLVISTSASVAHYRVREQLAFFTFPTDAVGTTHAVSGGIVLDSHGHIVAAQSKITVDLRTLHTDQSRRDGYVQSNVLQTDAYPYAVFVVRQAQGLPSRLGTSGKINFKLIGTLTVHGVTRSTTWSASATLTKQKITGTAATQFSMTEFGITPPQIGPVLSVQNTVKLDVTLVMTRVAA